MMKRILLLSALILTMATLTAQVYLDPQAPMEERVKDALSRMTTHEKIQVIHAQSKFTSAGVPRLGIRQLNMDDGPHGVREELEWNTWNPARWTNDSIVAFPSLTCLASTWNRDLSRLYGHSVSEEFAFRGKDVMLGPGVNIARTPMNGRAFEYMGEDPCLAGEMVVPYIQAAQKNGVACCLKHYVLNDQETNRFGTDVIVSERALREIYLEPFRRAVDKAHVWSIMGSYNMYKGIHCCQHEELNNGILKGEWQWDGAIISDWGGTTDTWQAATGGLDIEMGSFTDGKVKESEFTYDDYYMARPLEQLINEGKIPMSVLDEKAGRVLRLIFRTAMNPKKVIGSQCSEAHYDACRTIAEEGIVLLKNEAHPQPLPKGGESGKILPLDFSKYKHVLVVGENATRSLTQGGGSSELKTLRDITPFDAICKAWQQANQTYSPSLGEGLGVGLCQGYTSGRALYDQVDTVDPAESERLKAEALEKARQADLIIYIGGLNKNTRQDCENGDRESYDLSFGQNELISQLAQIQPNIVVVTFGGNAYATPWLQQVKALVHCWYLGSEAGTALANVLTGKVCPSGKLPVTFAKRYEDYPYVRFGKDAYQDRSGHVDYREGIYVGYRGFERNKMQAQFPFGYGLSYTTFQYGQPTAQVNGDQVNVEVTVRNTGSVAGKEVAQVYVSAPKNKQMDKPVKELKGFAKTRLLQPGESQTLRISIARSELASWNETTHKWQVDSGTYTLQVGGSSADIRGKAKITL